MELKKLFERNDILISRKEYIFKVDFEGATPKRSDIREKIASQIMVKPEMMVVRRIDGEYGKNSALVMVYVYDDKGMMSLLERRKMLEKNGLVNKEEGKTEAKVAAEAKEA